MPNKKSPLYNYKSPRDYPVFNMGNEASPPFKMKYSNSAFPFKSPLKHPAIPEHENPHPEKKAKKGKSMHELITKTSDLPL